MYTCPAFDGQHHSDITYKPQRKHVLKGFLRSGSSDIDMVYPEEYCHLCRAHSWNRHNHQLQRYFSYSPDPESEAVDALAQNWKNMKSYSFPLFNLLRRCLKKVHQERVQTVVIIAPVWQGYPALIESIIDFLCTPLTLSSDIDESSSPSGTTPYA